MRYWSKKEDEEPKALKSNRNMPTSKSVATIDDTINNSACHTAYYDYFKCLSLYCIVLYCIVMYCIV